MFDYFFNMKGSDSDSMVIVFSEVVQIGNRLNFHPLKGGTRQSTERLWRVTPPFMSQRFSGLALRRFLQVRCFC